MARDPLPVELDRWVGEGLISESEARAVAASELRRSTASIESGHEPEAATIGSRVDHRRPSLAAEVFGSLGAICAAVAAVIGTSVLWSDLESGARVLIPALGTAILFAAGAVVPSGDGATERLRSLLLLLACGALAGMTAISTHELFGWAAQNVVLAAGGVTASVALVLVWRQRSAHVHLAAIGALVAVTVGLVIQYDYARASQVGTALVGLGLAVVALAWARVWPSPMPAYVGGAVVLMVGAQLTGELADHWPIVVGLAMAVMFLVVFVLDRQRFAIVLGLLFTLVFTVQGIVRATQRRGPSGDRNTWIVFVVFAIGIAVLAAAIITIRGPHRPDDVGGQHER